MANKPVKMNSPDSSLYHYGIKGQKWGLRRFQNSDGTRTSAGKKRYDDPPEAVKTKQRSEDHNQSRANKAKGIDELSNDELRRLNERLQLEDAYKKLTAEKITKSENWVKQSIAAAGKAALTDFTKGVFLGGAKLVVKKLSPEFADVAFNLKEKKG